MESEAEFGDGELSVNVGLRRRSTSISDDYSIQKTNDDATECKYAAVKLNYYTDNFIERFILTGTEPLSHRDPEISQGYWARVYALRRIVDNFLANAGSSCQIINLGAGFDTLYWRLKKDGSKFKTLVEVDFSSVTAKKIRQLRKPGNSDLVSLFSQPIVESNHTDLHAGDYHLVGADMRQPREFKTKLESSNLDFSLPTLFIAECVLVYMSAEQSSALLKELSEWFKTAVFVNYEQICIKDPFGKIMKRNLEQRGILLPGLSVCESVEAQEKRFTNNGWTVVNVWNMQEIYCKMLPKSEIQRIEKIESLDEKELLTQLLEHYCIGIAVRDATGENEKLKNTTP